MLISVEHEIPAVALNGDAGVDPAVFTSLWEELTGEGWLPEGKYAISRQVTHPHPHAQRPSQMISTDTGPTVEMCSSPSETVGEIDNQLKELHLLVGKKLGTRQIGLLGSGINPHIGTSSEEYYLYRTPRTAYDYAIRERGWCHRTILNIAAMQEVVDIDTARAPAILAVMHRLAGVFLFLNRNDPDLGKTRGSLSIRPKAWRDHVPTTGMFASDRLKVYLPQQEVNTWQAYMRLLWNANPMFILGTKSCGLVYIPEHPTFGIFISSPPSGGWIGRRLDNNEEVRVIPDMGHVMQTDWTYMGFARLRLFWKGDTMLSDVVEAYRSDDRVLEAFLSCHLEKVLLENRASASPPPGEEMCSLAFIVGLIENFDAVERFVKSKPYSFWLAIAHAAEHLPMKSRVEGVEVTEVLSQALSLSQSGLIRRAGNEEEYLEPLVRRIRENQSPSERMLTLYETGKEEAILEHLLYRFPN